MCMCMCKFAVALFDGLFQVLRAKQLVGENYLRPDAWGGAGGRVSERGREVRLPATGNIASWENFW